MQQWYHNIEPGNVIIIEITVPTYIYSQVPNCKKKNVTKINDSYS